MLSSCVAQVKVKTAIARNGASIRLQSAQQSAAVTLDTVTINPPAGLVAFTDGPALLGVVTLDGTGQAVLTPSTLAVGLHAISAYYIGVAGFDGSESAELFELVGWRWPA